MTDGTPIPQPERAADLGHDAQWDPHPQSTKTSRWTCPCGRSVLENSKGIVYGSAARDACTRPGVGS